MYCTQLLLNQWRRRRLKACTIEYEIYWNYWTCSSVGRVLGFRRLPCLWRARHCNYWATSILNVHNRIISDSLIYIFPITVAFYFYFKITSIRSRSGLRNFILSVIAEKERNGILLFPVEFTDAPSFRKSVAQYLAQQKNESLISGKVSGITTAYDMSADNQHRCNRSINHRPNIITQQGIRA